MAFKPFKNLLGNTLMQGMTQTNNYVNNLSGSSNTFQNPYQQNNNQGGGNTISPQDDPYQTQGFQQGGGAGAMLDGNDNPIPPQPQYSPGVGMQWNWNGSSWVAEYVDIGSIDYGTDPIYDPNAGQYDPGPGQSSNVGHGQGSQLGTGVTGQGEGFTGGMISPNPSPNQDQRTFNVKPLNPNVNMNFTQGTTSNYVGGGGSSLDSGSDEQSYHEWDYNQDGFVDVLDILAGQSQGIDQTIMQEIVNMATGEALNWDEGENIQTEQQGQFQGGGGRGATAAKKLFYPSSSGGFTSVGSGIGDDMNASALQKLLEQIQG